MAATDEPLLIQFAKWPEKGRVKTRLAAALGEQGALDAHVALTRAVLDQLMATGYPVSFWWDRSLEVPPDEAAGILGILETSGITQKVQSGEDLGARMTRALRWGIGSAGRAIIVGSDCPSVDADYIGKALEGLENADVVIGPADDGGYVLIGARTTTDAMLAGIDWGTPRAFEQTCRRLRQEGLRYQCLAPLWDVDEPEDWARFLSVGAEK
ncbi:hypothetical protein DES49_2611 [Halospina denitrificans]|uniref:Glycosyltransferase n=1 Tax=Halospina denitrificans TaxID=332522 RepID=A0A4R7JN53_9GAMM|nr:TIGR04282 family arsenosugar biosynthesis glycosyltransferase [Halospina denitrificans]TDT38627.1 hypothetical protein DES49_2611 [Halospina denitrificans]